MRKRALVAVMSGAASIAVGLLGAADPNPFFGHGTFRWRVFYTAQHGDNVTYEIETQP